MKTMCRKETYNQSENYFDATFNLPFLTNTESMFPNPIQEFKFRFVQPEQASV